MQRFMVALLTCSATMSALAIFYMVITPLLSKRYSAKSCYYTWLIVVVGLIIPFRPQFGNALVKVDVPSQSALPIIQLGNGVTPIKPVTLSTTLPLSPSISLWQILMIVWLVGMVTSLVYHAVKHYRFVKLTCRWSERVTNDNVISVLEKLKAEMSISKSVSVQLCASIGSPMMIGFIHPKILLPQIDFTPEELRFILTHELVHYKVKDLWYKALTLLATAIHWFNPVVYLVAKAIDTQCELSCDSQVILSTNADTRQQYSETIIGVIKYQSKLKTALSTNFYGGKKGMKKRIFSIMDMGKKKAGVAVLCGALIFTMGTGFAFAANAETQPQLIKEDIMVSNDFSYGYKFLPDPEVYAKYSTYGISLSDGGENLLYNGQRVRLFVDEQSDVEAFFVDESGTIDLAVIRNTAGDITGIKSVLEDEAQQYRSAFFAENLNVVNNAQDTTVQNKYEQYSTYGITVSDDGNVLYYNGQPVKLLIDMLSDGSFEAYWYDTSGAVNISVVRNETGKITTIESISEKKAQEYHSMADIYEQNALNGLDEKITERMKELYPEN